MSDRLSRSLLLHLRRRMAQRRQDGLDRVVYRPARSGSRTTRCSRRRRARRGWRPVTSIASARAVPDAPQRGVPR